MKIGEKGPELTSCEEPQGVTMSLFCWKTNEAFSKGWLLFSLILIMSGRKLW